MSRTAGAVDRRLRWASTGAWCLDDPTRISAVERATAHLVTACRAASRPLPIMPVLFTDGEVVQAHLAAPLEAPPQPWRSRGHVWSLLLEDLSPRIVPESPAWPAFVDVGTQNGWSVLVDLAAAPGLIEIDGAPAEIQDLLARIVVGLGSAPWSRGVRVTRLGDEVVRRGAVAPAPAWQAAFDTAFVEALGPQPVVAGGAIGRHGAATRGGHHVVVSSEPLSPRGVDHVRAVAANRSAPTVVAPLAAGAVPRGAWRWTVVDGEVSW